MTRPGSVAFGVQSSLMHGNLPSFDRAFEIDPHRREVAPAVPRATSLLGLARAVDVLVTVLPRPEELRQCTTDAFPALQPGKMWLDLTSGDPQRSPPVQLDALAIWTSR